MKNKINNLIRNVRRKIWELRCSSSSLIKHFRQDGIALLEFSLVAVLTLPLVLMTVDAVNIYRARIVLQESVDRGLRCLAPLEANCRAQTVGTNQQLYQVKLFSADLTWPIPHYQYQVNESQLAGSSYHYSEPRAQVLSHVNLDLPQYSVYNIHRIDTYSVDLNYNLLKASGPRVVMDPSNTNSALLPRFLYQKSSHNYPKEVINLSSLYGKVAKQRSGGQAFYKNIGSVSFKVPVVNNDLPCFKAKNLNSAAANESSYRGCNLASINTVIHLTGKFPVDPHAEGASGKLYLSLTGAGYKINGKTQSQITSQFNLGGRVLRYDSQNSRSANFVPRGAKLSLVNSHQNHYPEFSLYQDIQLIPGNTYSIDFYLQRDSTTANYLAWQGAKLKLYYEQFNLRREEYPCEKYNLITREDYNRSVSSNDLATLRCAQVIVNGKAIPSSALTNLRLKTTYQREFSGCESSEKDVLDCLECDVVFEPRCGGVDSKRYECLDNKGIKSLLDNGLLSKVCGLSSVVQKYAQNITFHEKTIPLSAELRIKKNSCLDKINLSEHLPADLAEYPKLTWGKVEKYQDWLVPADSSKDLESLKMTDQYQCDDFQLSEKLYDFNQSAEISKDQIASKVKASFLSGNYTELATGCNWEDAVSANAQEVLSLAKESQLKISRINTGYTYLAEKPSLACYNYLAQTDRTRTRSKLPEAPLATYGPILAEEIPAECQSDKYHCEITFVGFNQAIPLEDSYNKSQAAEVAYLAMQAAFPLAKYDCQNKDCFNLAVNLQDNNFLATASYQLPLLSLFGKKSVELSYSSQAVRQSFN